MTAGFRAAAVVASARPPGLQFPAITTCKTRGAIFLAFFQTQLQWLLSKGSCVAGWATLSQGAKFPPHPKKSPGLPQPKSQTVPT